MECKIVCDGKDVAVINITDDGCEIKCTEEGKKMCQEFCKGKEDCCK